MKAFLFFRKILFSSSVKSLFINYKNKLLSFIRENLEFKGDMTNPLIMKSWLSRETELMADTDG